MFWVVVLGGPQPGSRARGRAVRATLSLAVALLLSTTQSSCGSDGSPFSSASLEKAVDALRSQTGPDPRLLEVAITETEVQFQLPDGEMTTGFAYADGELEPINVFTIGGGSSEDHEFPLSDVDPAAVDRIIDNVRKESGSDGVEVTELTLDRGIFDRDLGWTVVADDGDEKLRYSFDPDGSDRL